MTISRIKIKQPTCPWWFLFTFDNPLRKLYQDPERILAPYLRPGDTAVDLGCGMGYFSLSMARLTGNEGKVIAVDVQPRMLAGLKRRAEKANLIDRIQMHNCSQDLIGVSGPVDFVLAFWMVHEVHRSRSFLEQIWAMLKDGGLLLLAEPLIHVREDRFMEIYSSVIEIGFSIIGSPSIGFSRSILAKKES